MGRLYCTLCGETLPQAGLHCPTCSADIGWWLIRGEEESGPVELRQLHEALAQRAFDDLDWVRLGTDGLRHKPETLAQIIRAGDYPGWTPVEDWIDFRNLFRLAIVVLLPLLVLVVILLYWLNHWPRK